MNRRTPARAAPQPIKGSWEDLFAEAQRLARNLNDDAIPAYRRLVDGLYKLPESQRSAGQGRLQSLLIQSAMGFQSYLNLRDRYDESLEVLSRLQQVVGDSAQNLWIHQKVDVLLQAGRVDEAYALQRQHAESPHGTLDDWGDLAMVYVRSGRPQAAKSVLSEIDRMEQAENEGSISSSRSLAEDEREDDAFLQGVRAIVNLECHDWESGMAAFERAMEENRSYADSLHLLYSRLAIAGRYDDALRYIARDSANPVHAALWRGIVLNRQGNMEEARRTWRNVTKLELTQQDQDSLFEYVLCHYSLGDKEGKGLGTILRAIQEQQTVPWIFLFLAGIGWALRGDLDTAANDLELALAQHKASALGLKLPHRLWFIVQSFLGNDALSRIELFFETETIYRED